MSAFSPENFNGFSVPLNKSCMVQRNGCVQNIMCVRACVFVPLYSEELKCVRRWSVCMRRCFFMFSLLLLLDILHSISPHSLCLIYFIFFYSSSHISFLCCSSNIFILIFLISATKLLTIARQTCTTIRHKLQFQLTFVVFVVVVLRLFFVTMFSAMPMPILFICVCPK